MKFEVNRANIFSILIVICVYKDKNRRGILVNAYVYLYYCLSNFGVCTASEGTMGCTAVRHEFQLRVQ